MHVQRRHVENTVLAEGLLFLGLVSPDTAGDARRYAQWLEEKRHAGMRYLEKYPACRQDVRALFPETKTILVLALPYDMGDRYPFEGPSRVAQYARFRDYHRVLREKGERIAGALLPPGSPFRVLVDTAPVLERALAAKTAQGFVGKNTCFIHPERGSFLLLAEILLPLDLSVDIPSRIDKKHKTKSGGCGPCRLCQDHCPTGALQKDYTLDAHLCLSYWTIEHRGPIPEKFWPHLAKYYFGCDICQLVCPYNVVRSGFQLPEPLKPRQYPALFDVATMGQKEYEAYFGGTPMTRATRNGLRRNALIAMAVTGDPLLERALEFARRDDGPPVGETVKQIEAYLLTQ